jgi:hypothetical protein
MDGLEALRRVVTDIRMNTRHPRLFPDAKK